MQSSSLPLLLVSVGSANPADIAQFLRDFADVLETQSAMGEPITQYTRGSSENACGGTAKVRWSRSSEEDRQFSQFKVSGEPRPYGEVREVCGIPFSSEEILVVPE